MASKLEKKGTDMSLQEEAIIHEYKTYPHTPELIDKTWQALWKIWGERVEHVFSVPDCDRTEEELKELEEEGRGIILVPNEIYTKEGLILLGRIFQRMRSWAVEVGTTIENDYNEGGCIDIETGVDSPNMDIPQEGLEGLFTPSGRKGQRLATYIVASQFSKLLTGFYFDGKTSSQLLGSRSGGNVVCSEFDSTSGWLGVGSIINPQYRHPDLGGRSEGMKKV